MTVSPQTLCRPTFFNSPHITRSSLDTDESPIAEWEIKVMLDIPFPWSEKEKNEKLKAEADQIV
jgi:hypothetical protein